MATLWPDGRRRPLPPPRPWSILSSLPEVPQSPLCPQEERSTESMESTPSKVPHQQTGNRASFKPIHSSKKEFHISKATAAPRWIPLSIAPVSTPSRPPRKARKLPRRTSTELETVQDIAREVEQQSGNILTSFLVHEVRKPPTVNEDSAMIDGSTLYELIKTKISPDLLILDIWEQQLCIRSRVNGAVCFPLLTSNFESKRTTKDFIDILAKSSNSIDNWLYFCLKSRSERLEYIAEYGNEIHAKNHTDLAAAWKKLVHGGLGAETYFLQIDFASFTRAFPQTVSTHPRPSAVAYEQNTGYSGKYLGRLEGQSDSKEYAPTLVPNEYFSANKKVHGDENTLKPDNEDKKSRRTTTKGDEVSTEEILELVAKTTNPDVQESGLVNTLEQDSTISSHSEGSLGLVHTEGENPYTAKDEMPSSPSEVLENEPTVPMLSRNMIQADTDGKDFKRVVKDPVVYERILASYPITEKTLSNLDVEFEMDTVRLGLSIIQLLKMESDVGRASLFVDLLQRNLLSRGLRPEKDILRRNRIHYLSDLASIIL